MERIYRGYPQALPVSAQEMKPYMLYRREERQEDSRGRSEKRRMREEQEYFKGLYPPKARKCRQFVEEVCDRMDRPGSGMYDEYPDREYLGRMRDRVMDEAERAGMHADRDMAWILLLEEVERRRRQKQMRE